MSDSALFDLLSGYGQRADRITHVEDIPGRPGEHAPWPAWLSPDVVEALRATGVDAPWVHQAAAADAAHTGEDVILSTGTASGKSLGFLLPILHAIATTREEVPSRQATALYLSPTKALAHDQFGKVRALPLRGLRPGSYDGDTSKADKDWARQHANLVFTNPDMLHRGILPGHPRFSRWLKSLRYIVVDEAHRYRGVFGSHVALIVRRLLRVAEHYGAQPVVIGASATMADPAAAFARFTGRPATAITQDTSPRAPGRFLLWEPPPLPGSEPGALDAADAPGDTSGPVDGRPGAGGAGAGAEAARALLADAQADPWADSALTALGVAPDPFGDSALVAPAPAGVDATSGATGGETEGGAAGVGAAGGGAAGREGGDAPGQQGEAGAVADANGLAPARRSTISEAADILADTTCAGYRSIAFIASRRGAEALADAVRDNVAEVEPELRKSIAAYRGGYLPEERRLLETGLRSGKLRTVASTNALELGIDIAGLDSVVMLGWPGTLASLWQQAGRAGRAGRPWIAVLIARDDPLDTFVVHHPESVFGAPVDAGVIDPSNPYVLGGHLCAAAAEAPLTEADLARFGPTAASVVESLTAARMLRRRPHGWYWAKGESAAALTDIRGDGEAQVRIVEQATGTLLGTIDDAGAHMQIHPGAVYLHQGISYVVSELDLEARLAMVERKAVDYTTQARAVKEIRIESTDTSRGLPSGGRVHTGTVEVTDQVVAYAMRQKGSGVRLGEYPLELPARTLRTQAVWWTAPADVLEAAGVGRADVPGAVHAAEHASIGLLPLFAGCDRWDIGGVSTAVHADTGVATVFVYDGQAGGAGFAERGYAVFDEWQRATLEAIASCGCAAGCPACVQSPKCGNGNEPLEKDAAQRLLRALLA
ncbi:DEAD/DEAH box helicase [Brevibacterium sp. BRM-1]|uniref:DEAD/DEAH box helicase n=1 Tax=Brevibacterium sp. BRM-1 TaxID=2999062 RepID=UPI00227DDA2A|nr:DEAD/DEAH box helicase [Brevibacterium sp. BRM-1]WAL39164.1 DEAD/DEAH box helicase [Brevibacterium sp. BRM-1]